MHYENGENVWQYNHAIVIPFAKFLYFVSINFRESVMKLVAIKKAFANCKRKYLGEILKIGHGRNIRKENDNLQIFRKFLPCKSLSLLDMLHFL